MKSLFKIDKRTRLYKNRKNLLATAVLAFIAGCILVATIRPLFVTEPLISPLSDNQPMSKEQIVEDYKNVGFGFERIKVEAKEVKEPVRRYTYFNHSHKAYYQRVMFWLQSNYIEFEDAAELIGRESGFNPKAVNPSSGACGLSQSLPCKKMGCSLDDVECQLAWQKGYIAKRYGTVTKALAFHDAHGYY